MDSLLENCDDHAFGQLLKVIGQTGRLPEMIESGALRAQIARGLGLEAVPKDRSGLEAAVYSTLAVPALGYDLAFPEVFYPLGVPHGREGFHAVLGNPPWDRMLPADKEFFASFEFGILDAPTKRERDVIRQRLLTDPDIGHRYDSYIAEFRDCERVLDSQFEYQIVEVAGERTIGKQDAFRAFMERNTQLLATGGWTGVVVPSAFHANEGATGVRRIYLQRMNFRHCYSFENRRKLFEIHSSFKFATVVSQAAKSMNVFSCAFYLHDDKWLFGDRTGRELLTYSLEFVQRTGGEYLSLLELRSRRDLEVAESCFVTGEAFGKSCERLGIRLGRELNMTDDAWRFTPSMQLIADQEDPRAPLTAASLRSRGYLTLYEGKYFHQFDDRWGDRPKFLVSLPKLNKNEVLLNAARFYRLAYRKIQNSQNERTWIMLLFPPGLLFGDSALCERDPSKSTNAIRLALQAISSSFTADWLLRQKSTANVNLFILAGVPIPIIPNEFYSFITKASLRLTCNHVGYEALWREQLGDIWRETLKSPFTWPVLPVSEERWKVRAAIDAVVAHSYSLLRDQYAHVLSAFSHKSYPKALELCLARFDELKAIGLDAFTKKYDPYWDIPLNENLPQPVIDLPVAEAEQSTLGDPALGPQFRLSDKPARQRAKRKR